MTTANLTVRVQDKRIIAKDICLLDLTSSNGQPLPAFEAGAHIDVCLREDRVRQYSLCNPPGQPSTYQIAVLLDPESRGGSKAVHEDVRAGDTLVISAPRNRFELVAGAPYSLLLAGGIGVTPLLAMAWTLLARGAGFQMHYFVRSAQRAAFRAVIDASPLASHVSYWFDDDAATARPAIDELIGRSPVGTHVYVCGPGGFIDHAIGACERSGLSTEHIHYERFQAARGAREVDEQEFTVVIGSTGQQIVVARDESVTEALARSGVTIPVSCEQGICGTCLTRVRGGIPDHRDQYLTEQERLAGDCFLPCCSRSLTPELVLDV